MRRMLFFETTTQIVQIVITFAIILYRNKKIITKILICPFLTYDAILTTLTLN